MNQALNDPTLKGNQQLFNSIKENLPNLGALSEVMENMSPDQQQNLEQAVSNILVPLDQLASG